MMQVCGVPQESLDELFAAGLYTAHLVHILRLSLKKREQRLNAHDLARKSGCLSDAAAFAQIFQAVKNKIHRQMILQIQQTVENLLCPTALAHHAHSFQREARHSAGRRHRVYQMNVGLKFFFLPQHTARHTGTAQRAGHLAGYVITMISS